MLQRALLGFAYLCLFGSANCAAIDSVLVDKSERKLYLLEQGKRVKSYHIALGANPVGRKLQESDSRTPEGEYLLNYKKSDSAFYKAIHISYPNRSDQARAKAAGVDPGGQIMLHGQRNGTGWLSFITQGFDWTQGCIAVTNQEMDELWELIEVGTPIVIEP